MCGPGLTLRYSDNILVLFLEEKAPKGQKGVGSIHLTHAHLVLRRIARLADLKCWRRTFSLRNLYLRTNGKCPQGNIPFFLQAVIGKSVRNFSECGDERLLV